MRHIQAQIVIHVEMLTDIPLQPNQEDYNRIHEVLQVKGIEEGLKFLKAHQTKMLINIQKKQ